jgi:hypothetical protein
MAYTNERYRVLVMLRRSDRPKSYDFHCFRCNMLIAEISGQDVVAFDDAIQVYQKVTHGVKCQGRLDRRLSGTGRCNLMYFFEEVK